MPFLKVYVDDSEQAQIELSATELGLSVSAFVRSKLQLENTVSRFSQILNETIVLAEALPSGVDFTVPDLYTAIEWQNITNEIGAGVLGKRFFENVISGNVSGVSPANQRRNRRELYKKA